MSRQVQHSDVVTAAVSRFRAGHAQNRDTAPDSFVATAAVSFVATAPDSFLATAAVSRFRVGCAQERDTAEPGCVRPLG